MVKRLCMMRIGDDCYDMEEDINGAYVNYSDYKALEEEYNKVKYKAELCGLTNLNINSSSFSTAFFDPHD